MSSACPFREPLGLRYSFRRDGGAALLIHRPEIAVEPVDRLLDPLRRGGGIVTGLEKATVLVFGGGSKQLEHLLLGLDPIKDLIVFPVQHQHWNLDSGQVMEGILLRSLTP